MGEVVARVEALARLAGDLDARLADAGAGGLAGACAIYERLRAVLDGVTVADLERMTAQVAEMRRALDEAARRIEALRALKALLERVGVS